MTVALIAVPATPARAENVVPTVVPSLRQWTGGSGEWKLAPASRILVSAADSGALSSMSGLLVGNLAAENGLRPAVVIGSTPAAGDIILLLDSSDTSIGDEGYLLTAGASLTIVARKLTGAWWGTRTLLQVLRADPARLSVPQGSAKDWPQ
ncbi:glycoside hydrolase family 20 zincin-like fold domain-containing protein [Kitasatospora sp. NPDC057015]|uniref:glycoside hydrolase family 20 zincin-like fold domain-containing protein n=1 Tax=Kitasatospora sp. NPDC057015 TaxID=3346001 RepID=UPI00363B964A